MTSLIQDLKYGLRMLTKNPGFTAVAVLTLALGIGANTAIFSVVNGLVFRNLPVPRPGKLVSFGFMCKGNPGIPATSYADLQDARHQGAKWVDLFAYRMGTDGLTVGDQTDRIATSYVTGNFFSGLGVQPALGRLILPSEGKPGGSDPIIVLSYSFWKSRFGGDPSIVGRSVRLDGKPLTVVGIAQKGFRGAWSLADIQAFVPLNVSEGPSFPWTDRTMRNLFVLGRLRPGVALSRADAAVQVIASRLAHEHPKSDPGATAWLLPERDASLTPFPKPGEFHRQVASFVFFLALALLVLLLACFNLANMLLVRATARAHEMAVRSALGAGRGRLAGQALTESFLLAIFGCGAGIVVAVWVSNLLQSIQINAGMNFRLNFGFDARVFLYATCAAVLAAILIGLVPALRAARANPSEVLHESGRTATGAKSRLRSFFVVGQTAGSVVLLIVAGLFMRGLIAVEHMDLGFNPDHLFKANMDPHEAGYKKAQAQQFYSHLLDRMRAIPGVKSASLALLYPSNAVMAYMMPVEAKGHAIPAGSAAPTIEANIVSPDYFKTMQIPIVRGRPFLDSDTATSSKVAVVNQTLARRLWPKDDPLGESFSISGPNGPWVKVVGIARNSTYLSIASKPIPYFYLPVSQNYQSYETLLVRTVGHSRAVMRSAESAVHSLAPGVPVWGVRTMRQTLDRSLAGFHALWLVSMLTVTLGLLGLMLAVLGVYGVISYNVSRRTKEFGIRIALGARPRDIQRIVFRQALILLTIGITVGLAAALAMSRVMAHVLRGVSAHDPLTYASVTLLIAGVTLLACYIPARRATKVDPMVALRYE